MQRPLPAGMRIFQPAALISTWFGSGLLPAAPGTWGSLAALPFGIAILAFAGRPALLAASVLLYVVGMWAANVYVRRTKEDDPGAVVVDEVVGQWLTLLAVRSYAWWEFVLAFVLFRVFDIVKPWPVSWAERRFGGGLGIMLDDVIAAIYASLSLTIIIFIHDVI
jgi:phosphatidylglycerophosphatase A